MQMESRLEQMIEMVREMRSVIESRIAEEPRLRRLVDLTRNVRVRRAGLIAAAVAAAIGFALVMPRDPASLLVLALIGAIVYDVVLSIALARRDAAAREEDARWWRYGDLAPRRREPIWDDDEEHAPPGPFEESDSLESR